MSLCEWQSNGCMLPGPYIVTSVQKASHNGFGLFPFRWYMYMEHTNGRMGKVYKNWQTQNRLVYETYRTKVHLGIFCVLDCLFIGSDWLQWVVRFNGEVFDGEVVSRDVGDDGTESHKMKLGGLCIWHSCGSDIESACVALLMQQALVFGSNFWEKLM